MYYLIQNAAGYWLRQFKLKDGQFTADWVLNPAERGYFFPDHLPVIFRQTMFTSLKVYQVQHGHRLQQIEFQKSEPWTTCLN